MSESFAPKPGCPMCSIVSSASGSLSSPTSPTSKHDILWKDDNFTAYRETAYPVSSTAHIIIAFNLHVPSIYTLSSTDLPLLVNIRNLAHRLLSVYSSSSPSDTAAAASSSSTAINFPQNQPDDIAKFRVGFITPPWKDNKIPVTDHLHAHAYIMPADRLGWWRGIAFGPVAWYGIEDLIAEIRESTSNNRIKSGYPNRSRAPIDNVPGAGARTGTSSGEETSLPPMGSPEVDLEGGEAATHLPVLTMSDSDGSVTQLWSPGPTTRLLSPNTPSGLASPTQTQIPDIKV